MELRQYHTIAGLCILATSILAFWYMPNIRGSQDINVYNRIGNDVQLFLEDEVDELKSEYPPLATTIFYIVNNNPFHWDFATGWTMLLVMLCIGTTMYSGRIFGPLDVSLVPFSILATVLLLGQEVVFARFDILLALLLYLAWRFHTGGKHLESGMFLVVACCLKLVPILLVPLLWLTMTWKNRLRFFYGSMIGLVIGVIIPMIMLGPAGFLSNIKWLGSYHAGRGIQIESTWSGIHMLYSKLRLQKDPTEFISMSVQNMSFGPEMATAALGLVVMAVLAIAFTTWRKKHSTTEQSERAFLATLLVTIGLSPVFSPQYVVWIMPLLIAWITEHVIRKTVSSNEIVNIGFMTLVFALATQWIYPINYNAFVDQSSIILLFIHTIRNLSIFALAWLLLRPHINFLTTIFYRMKYSAFTRRKAFTFATLSAIAIVSIGLIVGYQRLQPEFSDITYTFPNGETLSGEMPYFPEAGQSPMQASLTITLSAFHPTVLRIKPDDCIEEFTINGIRIPDDTAKFCDYGAGKAIALGEYLSPGVNDVHVVLHDQGGLFGLNITSDRSDLRYLLLDTTLVLLIVIGGSILTWLWVPKPRRPLTLLFFGGAILRFLYYLTTFYTVRGHDTDAHIDYIEYVAAHFSIPPAIDGWEYHQAPLYYFITGALMRVEQFFGRSAQGILLDIQFVSFLFAIGALVAGLWAVWLLFPQIDKQRKAILAGSLIATFPSLVFVTARISNDTLYQTLSFLFVAILIKFWKKGSIRDWYIACIIFALVFLTKVSALVFLPAMAIAFLFKSTISWKKRFLHGGLSALLIIVMAGWLPVIRLTEADNTKSLQLGNNGMHSGLLLENTPENFLTFNPIEILRTPYNNPWSDETRRKFFWEYFFRSAFFGEFGFADPLKPISQIILFGGLLSLIFIAVGIVHDLLKRWKDTLPILTLLFFLILSSFVYRFKFTYSSNQDFRFVVIALLPLAYYAVQGLDGLPKKLHRYGRNILSLLCTAFALFLIQLYFTPT